MDNFNYYAEDSVALLLTVVLDLLLVLDIIVFIVSIILALASATREPIKDARRIKYLFVISGTIMGIVYVATFNDLSGDWTRLFFRSALLVNYATISSFFWLEWRRAGR